MNKGLWIATLCTLFSGIAGSGASAARLDPSSEVSRSILDGKLTEILDVAKLPEAVRDGAFQIDGQRPMDWSLANPGAEWQATDVIVTPRLPTRRLIFAACDAQFCIVHYEKGGIAHSMHLLAFQRSGDAFKTVWHAVGFGYIRNFAALYRLISQRADTQFNTANGDDDF